MSQFKLVILLSYICIASASAAIITPALPAIEHYFSLSYGALEWVVTIFLLGYVIGQLIYGPLANHFGRLKSLRIGLAINLFGIFICLGGAYLPSFGLLLLGRLITALGAAAGLACTFMLIHDLLDEDKAKQALSFAIVSFTLGVGAAVTIGGVMTQYFGWPSIFWVLLLHGVIMLASTWSFPETLTEPQSLHITHLLKSYAHVLTNKVLVIFSLVVGATATISYCYSAAAPVIAQIQFHLTPSEYGYWNLINMVGMFASGFFAKNLLKRFRATTVIYIGLVGVLFCIISLLFLNAQVKPYVLLFFLTTMVLYFFGGVFFPSGAHCAMESVQDKANGASIMSFINMGIATLSVLMMGYLPFNNLVAFIVILIFIWVLITALVAYSRYL